MYLLWKPMHAFPGANEVLLWRGKKALAMCLGILGSPKCIHLFHTYPQIPNALCLPSVHRWDSKEHKKDFFRLEGALRHDRTPFTWLKIRCKAWRGSQNRLEVKARFLQEAQKSLAHVLIPSQAPTSSDQVRGKPCDRCSMGPIPHFLPRTEATTPVH